MSLIEKKNQFVSSVDEYLGNAVRNKIFHLNTNGESLDGRSIVINDNQKVINFGSCSYLGLEMDDRLINAGIDAFKKYGTQFSSSRAFLSSGQYIELESLISQMFDAHAIVSPSTTLGHISSIPTLVADNDAIIMDQQVHGSVQNAIQMLKPRGVYVSTIPHNNLEALEDKIKRLRDKHYRVWYMADGVYSMYGDYAPIKDLYNLMDKYQQLHLYIDDAHGMSWTGPNGTGYITSQVKLRPKVYLATSLNKAFASGGGALIFQEKDDMRKVRTSGSTFVFSGPMQPPQLGVAIASAKIHLSDEIYQLQDQLKEKIRYTDFLIKEKKLPYVFSSGSPIFYIGLGIPSMGYNIVKKLIDEGFYVDIGIFPGVSLKNTGIRLAINNSVTLEDIKQVIDAIAYCYPKVLLEERQTVEDIGKHFAMDFSYASILNPIKEDETQPIKIKHYHTINEVDKAIWNKLLGDRGSFDWNGCQFLEEAFKGNPEPENNWKFHYYLVFENEKPILATFVTELLCKDDMLSPESVSKQIEIERKLNKYYLTSKVMMMGSLLTEGEHLYLNKSSLYWREAMDLLLEAVQLEQEKCKASAIQLRDIDSADEELKLYLMSKGFVKSEMPDSWQIEDLNWDKTEEMIGKLSSKSRHHIRTDVLRYSEHYTIETSSHSETDIKHWRTLYENVQAKSHKTNTFKLPKKIFECVKQNSNWETIELFLNNDYLANKKQLVGVIFCYKNGHNYCPMFIGIDYSYQKEYNVYKQALFQIVLRANSVGMKKIYLGMEADTEKKKLNAKQHKRVVFIQANENFNLQKLGDYNVQKTINSNGNKLGRI